MTSPPALPARPFDSIVDRSVALARHAAWFTLAAAALLVAILLIGRVWYVHESEQAHLRLLEAQRLVGEILLTDERLTMSAYMVAASMEPRWIDRYRRHMPEMDAALAAAQAIAPAEVSRRFADASSAANDRLVALEAQVIEAAYLRDSLRALAILDSNEYVTQKRLLSDATRAFTDSTIAAMREEVERLNDRAATLAAVLAGVAMVAGLVIWWTLNRSLARSKSRFREAERRVHERATSDALTGLSNRPAFLDDLTDALGQADREGHGLALMMIDLDRFKPINDEHGHATGDAVLAEVGARLNGLLRQGELRARLGGDEFVVVVAEPEASSDVAGHIAQRVLSGLLAPVNLANNLQVGVGASIGIARFPTDALDGATLMRLADRALYRAKGSGRSCVCFFEAESDGAAVARHAAAPVS